MQIVMAHSHLATFGGGERFVLEVSKRLSARHELVLYTSTFLPEATYPDLAQFPLVKVHQLHWPFLRLKADVILTHTFGANLLAFRNSNVAYYVHSLRSQFLTGGKRPDLILRRALDTQAMRRVRRVIANSQFTANKFRNLYQREATDQVYCGIDPLFFHLPEQLGDYALYVGRLAPEKGVERLLKWWEPLDYPLYLVGSGEPAYVEYLKRQSSRHISFLGAKVGAAMLSAYQRCRFVVYLPFEEELGIVPLEAMGAAKPVIVSNEGGLIETVQHEQTGFLVNDAAAFQQVASHLIASDEACQSLGGAARKHVQAFTWDRTADQIEHICATLAAS
jgi:glycosyltransferase involved in cell wall biosynthesis